MGKTARRVRISLQMENWIYIGDNNNYFYCFSAEDGQRKWVENIGPTFGSPTTVQKIEDDGLRYVYANGGDRLWGVWNQSHHG